MVIKDSDDAVNYAWICRRFMLHLRRETRGHVRELTPMKLTNRVKRFAMAYGIDDAMLLKELMALGYVVPSASDTWEINLDKIR